MSSVGSITDSILAALGSLKLAIDFSDAAAALLDLDSGLLGGLTSRVGSGMLFLYLDSGLLAG